MVRAMVLMACALVPVQAAAQDALAALPRNDVMLTIGWAGSEHIAGGFDR